MAKKAGKEITIYRKHEINPGFVTRERRYFNREKMCIYILLSMVISLFSATITFAADNPESVIQTNDETTEVQVLQ